MSTNEIIIAMAVFVAVIIIAIIILTIKFMNVQKPNHSSSNIDFLLNKIIIYMRNVHPCIQINYDLVRQKVKLNKNSSLNGVVMVENVVSQFARQRIKLTAMDYISQNELWDRYAELSYPIRNKPPRDLNKRMALAFLKSHGECARCGATLKIEKATVHLIRSVENGGTYHFENISIVCRDCNRIMKVDVENEKRFIETLNIYDELLNRI